MNSKQIETFLAICNYKTFTKASERLYTTQPVISRQLASLEHELGFQLFYRNRSNNTQITEQGQLFAEFIKRCSAEYDVMMEEVNSSLKKVKPKIKLGFESGRNLPESLDTTIQMMWQESGFSAVSIYFNSFPSITSQLLDGNIELACIDEEFIFPYLKNLEVLPIREARAKLLISKDHPLAEERNLSLKDFADDTFIMLTDWAPPNTADATEFFKEYFKKENNGFGERTFLIAPDMTNLIYWCGVGIGVAAISPWHGDLDMKNCILIDIPELRLIREVLVWRRNTQSLLVKNFVKYFKSIATK